MTIGLQHQGWTESKKSYYRELYANKGSVWYSVFLPCLTGPTEEITEEVQHDVDRLIFRLVNEDPLYTWFLMLRVEKAHLMRVWTLREQGHVELDHLSALRRRQSLRARSVDDYLKTVSKYKVNVLTVIRRLKSRALDLVYLTIGTLPSAHQEHSA